MTTIAARPDIYISDRGDGDYDLHFRDQLYDGYQLGWCKSFIKLHAKGVTKVPLWNAQTETWGRDIVVAEGLSCTAP